MNLSDEAMRIVVISPEAADAREVASMEGFFDAGLERYHVRKPAWSAAELRAWVMRLPHSWRERLVLHEHHPLAAALGLRGWHEKDREGYPLPAGTSRSCHDMASLRRHAGHYEYLLFGPVFSSISKRGYGPAGDFPWDDLRSFLADGERRPETRVLAVGGVTASGLARCSALGFDGAAVLGAVWHEADPVGAYRVVRDAAARLEVKRHAA